MNMKQNTKHAVNFGTPAAVALTPCTETDVLSLFLLAPIVSKVTKQGTRGKLTVVLAKQNHLFTTL